LRSRQIADCEAEKTELSAERDALSTNLDETRQASRQRLDALAETRDSLLEMSEKQRRQIEEQMARIAQLEAANARLGQELLTSSPQSGSSGALPYEITPPSAQRAKARRKPNAGGEDINLATSEGTFCEASVDAEPDRPQRVMT
jgi:hypothetical protein